MLNKAVLWNLSYGVYIVSTMENNKPVGCVANSIMQLTHDTIAISLNHQNYTNKITKETKKLAISILNTEVEENLIPTFGFCSSKDRNKFENVEYKLIDNLPIITNANGYITLEIIENVELETHTLFVGKIINGDILNNSIPMTYKYYHEVIKGRAPKTAPTYIEEEITKEGIKYKCSICGYIYEGDIDKENNDFFCPICKQPKNVFVKI
ncbi:MAG: flavin reductase [Candidatus Gastranaerophilales bacterium]|nr:flavin reductase [Candidatus Gastranaerophilales bacterium]